MADQQLSCHYREADIILSCNGEGLGQLWINGLLRDSGIASSLLRLDSVVQTDYEFHEHVVGLIETTDQSRSLTLYMSHTEIGSKTFALESQ
ncbi:MAG: hypothetical protein ISP92_02150 [Pseudomonadales bacterium]|jgi:hypothetical protein|nr:hypothetical protein [Pseudomonadales bacterium]MDA0760230.1 hypothetical protein [Pseudomonadota bacterium]MDA0958712.1 hypothetical protein [Pseudomonadota bacterium]